MDFWTLIFLIIIYVDNSLFPISEKDHLFENENAYLSFYEALKKLIIFMIKGTISKL
jgi:hypothetical protein